MCFTNINFINSTRFFIEYYKKLFCTITHGGWYARQYPSAKQKKKSNPLQKKKKSHWKTQPRWVTVFQCPWNEFQLKINTYTISSGFWTLCYSRKHCYYIMTRSHKTWKRVFMFRVLNVLCGVLSFQMISFRKWRPFKTFVQSGRAFEGHFFFSKAHSNNLAVFDVLLKTE